MIKIKIKYQRAVARVFDPLIEHPHYFLTLYFLVIDNKTEFASSHRLLTNYPVLESLEYYKQLHVTLSSYL